MTGAKRVHGTTVHLYEGVKPITFSEALERLDRLNLGEVQHLQVLELIQAAHLGGYMQRENSTSADISTIEFTRR